MEGVQACIIFEANGKCKGIKPVFAVNLFELVSAIRAIRARSCLVLYVKHPGNGSCG